ncbi:GNAT family N-acetyltransferase [Sphingobium sp. AP49]|uniref:GNAT family N-acetyltransferase n=1 Tax=Sphingobium sp. AP49 TaxID=1144307 RepID=UPI0024B38D36|nr:GNAT family N-acetyltransferase [Sphingobium sp. AP49]WHO40370.1 GNAT family N-acetyltransferase [Sphingobium sp. AP49]
MLHGVSDFDAACAQAAALRVETLRLDAAIDVARVARAWDRLEARAQWPTQTRLFAATLSRLPAGADAQMLGAWLGDDLVGLLSLSRDPGYFARWHMVGARETYEPGDILCNGSVGTAGVADELVGLRRPLYLDRISAGSPLIAAMAAAMRGRGRLVVRPAMACPFITLDDSWRDPESRFNAGRRSDFRRARRRAEGMGILTFETLSPGAADFDTLFDEAVRVEALGWKCAAGTAIATDPRQAAIFRTFFRAAAERGDFRLSFMRIDGQAVAMQMALLWNSRYWLFKIGHDASFNACSPGGLLMLHALGWAAAARMQTFEFLGVAEPWIRQLWTQEQHDCVQLRTYPYGLRGAVALAVDGGIWLRQRLRRGR